MKSGPRFGPTPLSRGLAWYFLATPLFVAIDFYVSAPIRVAALGDSVLRWPYYAFAFCCGLLCRRWPRWAPAVGMAESSINLLLLMIGILMPIWGGPDRVAAGEPLVGPFDEVSLTNFVVSGTVFLTVFYHSQTAIGGARR